MGNALTAMPAPVPMWHLVVKVQALQTGCVDGAHRLMAAPAPAARSRATLTTGQLRHGGSAACRLLAGEPTARLATAYILLSVSGDSGEEVFG